MKFAVHTHIPKRKKSIDFGDLVSIPLAPPNMPNLNILINLQYLKK